MSSHGVLDYTGAAILTAKHGTFGTLLLDPYNITIANTSTSNASSSSTSETTTYTATGDNSIVDARTLLDNLATANVTVTTGGAGSSRFAGRNHHAVGRHTAELVVKFNLDA